MPDKKANPGFVTRDFCDERFSRITDKLDTIITDVGVIKKDVKNGLSHSRFSGRDKALIFIAVIGVLGSIVSAYLAYLKP